MKYLCIYYLLLISGKSEENICENDFLTILESVEVEKEYINKIKIQEILLKMKNCKLNGK
jgi:ribosomal protein L12E/L44/L45/RPP1/RPP2